MSKQIRRITLVALAVLASAFTFGAASASAALPVVYNTALSAAPSLLNPQAPPAGANDWNCKPSAAHPRPVVLVHGTFANMGENWGTLSPLLKNNGYCVFALNYGATSVSMGFVYALGSVATSAQELSAFVDRVRSATGASKVDIVGHSQGGMMPNYYIKFLGGASKVNTMVWLAPDNHGTDVNGLLKLANGLSKLFPKLSDIIYGGIGSVAPGLTDQKFDSPLIKKLTSVPDTVPGVKYTVIATKYDEVVTPYKSAFLSGSNVNNITIQNKCILDLADHIAIAFDHVALREVLNALDPAHARGTICTPVAPVLGG
jgi:triacylglycerol esterase/lipase EstA (alpha/beta hydrolase family)